MSKSCIITGGSGLVGSNFKDGIKINSSHCDLMNYDESYNKIKSFNPDSIIHCAAMVGGLYYNIQHPLKFFEKNIQINSNILKISHELGVKKFIGFLSTCIFPDNLGRPYKETDLHTGPPHDSNFGYAYAKRMLEVKIRAYRKEFGYKYFCVIPTNVYGYNDNFDIDNGHVVPALIHKIYNAKNKNEDLVIKGTGKAKREFIFARDLANICNYLLNHYDGDDSIIVSDSDNEIAIKELVDILVEVSNFKGNVIYDTSYSDGQLVKKTDNSKLKDILENFEFTPLEKGLKKTYEWFENNYEEARK